MRRNRFHKKKKTENETTVKKVPTHARTACNPTVLISVELKMFPISMFRRNVFHHKRLHLCPKNIRRQITERSTQPLSELSYNRPGLRCDSQTTATKGTKSQLTIKHLSQHRACHTKGWVAKQALDRTVHKVSKHITLNG